MKRWAMAAFLLLALTTARTEAGSLPKPRLSIDEQRPSYQTHSVRGNRAKLPEPDRGNGRDAHRGLRVTHGVRGK